MGGVQTWVLKEEKCEKTQEANIGKESTEGKTKEEINAPIMGFK
jgi:hypothetical protein